MVDDKTIKPEYGLQTEFCKDKERLLSVVDQLAAQGKQIEHHTGDLPSVKADASGVAAIHFESRTIRVGGSANDIVGKGLIVHRDPDDFKTQPTGNAGPRLACAVITAK